MIAGFFFLRKIEKKAAGRVSNGIFVAIAGTQASPIIV